MREILVELAEDEAGEAVIVEGEDDFGPLDDAGMEIAGSGSCCVRAVTLSAGLKCLSRFSAATSVAGS